METGEQMAYYIIRFLTLARNCAATDDCGNDRQRFNMQFIRAFDVASKQQLNHRQGTVCQGATECYSSRFGDTHSQIREAQSMGLAFIRSQTGSISVQTKIFSQQKEHTSTDLHVSNGGGPISKCYASLAAAAAVL